MNAVEIEKALSELIAQPFDAETFPWEFLRAFGNKETTIKRLMTGNTNKSDVGGVLQRQNIHIKALEEASDAAVSDAFQALRDSEQTARQKARFVLATDGQYAEFLDRHSDTYRVCSYADLAAHFADFLPLAGIETVAQIRDHALDIRATNRLNKLYVQILQDNPAWNADDKADAMNHFMARLIFCYFAEDTQIFGGESAFSQTVGTMTQTDGSNVAEVLQTLFDVMDCPQTERDARNFPSWASDFPYVNGNLFSDSLPIPTFSRISRAYLTELGGLDWSKINPDIFGSMIQAVADPEERSEAGMHYTSVPNILKVLNPLFLNDLREQLEAAGDNARKLLNLRKRIAHIRVFDPACGSGNFLVIAYKQLREIEAEINRRRGETALASGVKLTNFRGIEIRNFAAEIARLALIIAQYQCDVLYRGQQAALKEFLPLQKDHWIVQGNALRLDWKSICPPTGTSAAIIDTEYDLFNTPLDQPAFAFENEGGETYIVGNPPYVGNKTQTKEQKADLEHIAGKRISRWRSLDYVAGWIIKAADYQDADIALVTTNSICQGSQVQPLWTTILNLNMKIHFAVRSFKWSNLAAYNAGVTVIILGLTNTPPSTRAIYEVTEDGALSKRICDSINPYLIPAPTVMVESRTLPFSDLSPMTVGNIPRDGGNLFLSYHQLNESMANMIVGGGHAANEYRGLVRRVYGSREFIRDEERYCLWIQDRDRERAERIPDVKRRIEAVRAIRLASRRKATREGADRPYQFDYCTQTGDEQIIIVPSVSSEARAYLPVGLLPAKSIVTNLAFALYDAPIWNLALIASRMHLVWVGTVCGKMKTDFRYSNTLGWNTFPIGTLTEKNREDLTRCAEDILLAREAHFPATIADLYDGERMPDNLRAAHERNDEVVERIFMGRKARHDTERLERLFQEYARLTQQGGDA